MSVPEKFRTSFGILFEKHATGFRARSGYFSGFEVASADWDTLRADLEPRIKDVLRERAGISLRELQWIPPLSTVAHRLLAEGSAGAQVIALQTEDEGYPTWRLRVTRSILTQFGRALEWGLARLASQTRRRSEPSRRGDGHE